MKEYILFFLLLGSFSVFAQTGTIKGTVTDKSSQEPIPFANVALFLNGNEVLGTTTDFDGKYTLKPIYPANYTVQVSYVGYQTKKVPGVVVNSGKITEVNVALGQGVSLEAVVIQEYSRPLFARARRKARRAAKRSVNVQENVTSLSVRGQRSGASVTFIDGVKVIGNGLNEVEVFEQFEESTAFDGESYQELVDNPFESPKKTPLSTFSIDVDKAAYANTRRFINQGHLPPVDAVRIEELINYFHYDYPQPEGEHPFSITTEMADCPWNKKRKLALIGIQGKEVDMQEAPNSNLVFLIDVSGSMQSQNKLSLLKKGLGLLIDELRENDQLAIVVYAGAAGVVLESTPGEKKKEIRKVLQQLRAGGSTAGGAGIQLAYKIAQENFIEGGNNRIILATDGDFNVGTSSQEALVKLIEKKRESGVFLSVLGFGMGNLQDYKMEQLANKGNGNYNYIDNLLEAKKVLVSEMGGTLLTIAKDVKVQAEFNPAKVKAYRLIGYVNRALAAEDFNDDRKDAGELGAGHSVTALYEIIPAHSSEKIMDVDTLKYQKLEEPIAENFANEVLTVKFRYKQPEGKESILLQKVMKDEALALSAASLNLQFSSAVASFGMKLRGSESTAEMSFSEIISLAKQARGEDEEGYRAEFIKMVEMAELIQTSTAKR